MKRLMSSGVSTRSQLLGSLGTWARHKQIQTEGSGRIRRWAYKDVRRHPEVKGSDSWSRGERGRCRGEVSCGMWMWSWAKADDYAPINSGTPRGQERYKMGSKGGFAENRVNRREVVMLAGVEMSALKESRIGVGVVLTVKNKLVSNWSALRNSGSCRRSGAAGPQQTYFFC